MCARLCARAYGRGEVRKRRKSKVFLADGEGILVSRVTPKSSGHAFRDTPPWHRQIDLQRSGKLRASRAGPVRRSWSPGFGPPWASACNASRYRRPRPALLLLLHGQQRGSSLRRVAKFDLAARRDDGGTDGWMHPPLGCSPPFFAPSLAGWNPLRCNGEARWPRGRRSQPKGREGFAPSLLTGSRELRGAAWSVPSGSASHGGRRVATSTSPTRSLVA
jgi:hypothetical protein